MATAKSSSGKRSSGSGTGKNTKSTGRRSRSQAAMEQKKAEAFRQEIALWCIVAVSLLLFISNFGVGGAVGGAVSGFLFGVFGLVAYFFPVLLLVGSFFAVSNRGNRFAVFKFVAAVLLTASLCVLLSLILTDTKSLDPVKSFVYCYQKKTGGGIVGGALAYILCSAFGEIGAYIIDMVVLIVSLVLLTERSAMKGMQKGGQKVYKSAKENHEYRIQQRERRRMDRKAEGVSLEAYTVGPDKENGTDDISELHPQGELPTPKVSASRKTKLSAVETEDEIPFEPAHAKGPKKVSQSKAVLTSEMTELFAETEPVQEKVPEPIPETNFVEPNITGFVSQSLKPMEEDIDRLLSSVQLESVNQEQLQTESEQLQEKPIQMQKTPAVTGADRMNQGLGDSSAAAKSSITESEIQEGVSEMSVQAVQEELVQEYVYPPIDLLKHAANKSSGNTEQHLRETASKLQQTLKTFGVNVTVTDISCGPAVTRYEIQPEMGVKVSKIVNLADDIKLNLAAADIRIEAPIPGKAAVGIEVPNKENVTVSFRELIESSEFENAKSKISFAVGRDIAGKVKVADIAKMPHLLIAGATGSGKSVCINTIIMSILYKADPNEVKLIMIDPKVVELSVYNGIPHLMIPVVTDPKKAASALNWAVQEMEDRYNKFAETGVRKFEEYNAKIDKIQVPEGQEPPKKMSQLVIIVDELADLMMVASHEVEDAICRLAQLARAAGIHLVIATQRPSVNVITGLIKANMPSRIAFAVTSGIDSRTILDMNGAEKLLGKGDMLFNPQGVPKPLRVQGAFVSDDEVSAVVDFLKNKIGRAHV